MRLGARDFAVMENLTPSPFPLRCDKKISLQWHFVGCLFFRRHPPSCVSRTKRKLRKPSIYFVQYKRVMGWDENKLILRLKAKEKQHGGILCLSSPLFSRRGILSWEFVYRQTFLFCQIILWFLFYSGVKLCTRHCWMYDPPTFVILRNKMM